jgi:flagellar capping protein FliD
VQILNNVNSTFFPLNSTRSTSNNVDVRITRDAIISSNSPQKTKQGILFEFDSVFMNRRKVPSLGATGPIAAFRVADAISLLSKQSVARKIPIVDNLDKSERFTLLKLRQLDDLITSLKSLGKTVSELLVDDALNPKTASSTRPKLVQALAGKDSPLNSYRITPVRLSQEAILASDEQATPLGALGLTGSFSINGTKITVEATDSLFELKNKINFGEDLNRNGVLDKTEDINNNGKLDVIRTTNREFVQTIFIAEDLDGDGEIDLGEDINNNKNLDGGTAENKVRALIQDNRLVLVGLAGGRTEIDLQDNTEILLSLGFFELNSKGFPIGKEFQFDSDDQTLTNLIQEPQTARIYFNGKQVPSDKNVFSGVIQDTDLIIKKVSEKAVHINISIDVTTFFSQIKNLVEQFNNSISKINNLLEVSKTFKRDGDIQDIRNDLTFKPQARVRELDQRNHNIDTLRGRSGNPFLTGIKVVNTQKSSMQEVSIAAAVQVVKSEIGKSFQSDDEKLLRRLGAIGIHTLSDDTFALDEKELRRALDSNTVEVFDLFANSETGVLPSLAETLTILLREKLGKLAIKENEIITQFSSPKALPKNFRKFTENAILKNTIQTLISIV